MVVILFASYSTALGQNPNQAYQLVKGSLRFYPPRTYGVQAQVQLRHGLGKDEILYKKTPNRGRCLLITLMLFYPVKTMV